MMNQDLLSQHRRLGDRGVWVDPAAVAALGPNGVQLMNAAMVQAQAAAIHLRAKTGRKCTPAEIRDAALKFAVEQVTNRK